MSHKLRVSGFFFLLLLILSIFFAKGGASTIATYASEIPQQLITLVKDPYHMDMSSRIFAYSRVNPIWWDRQNASYYEYLTFESTDPNLPGKTRSFWVPFIASTSRGLEMAIMNGTVPGSSYEYFTGSLTESDDFHLFFPASPSGEINSPVHVTGEKTHLDLNLYVPTAWWTMQ